MSKRLSKAIPPRVFMLSDSEFQTNMLATEKAWNSNSSNVGGS